MGIQWVDSFVNLLAGIGVSGRDKFASQQYAFNPMTQFDLEAAFRGDWIARKIVEIPAFDMTRQWRQWQADEAQVELLEECERYLYLQQKLQQALIRSRLYGGAIMVMGVDVGAPEEELDPASVGKDGLKFLHVVSMLNVTVGPRIYDVTSPYYGLPSWYAIRSAPPGSEAQQSAATEQIQLHPSRVVRFLGLPPPDPILSGLLWGDSVLQPVNDAVKMCGLVSGSLATLISELKIDIIKIPDMAEIVSTAEGTAKLQTRFATANAMKSVINTVVLDSTEEWQRVQANLAGVPDIITTYLQIASGAADIPAGRFLGLPHRGLNVTGEADFRNYYDKLAGEQTTVLTPAMSKLDEVLIRSALGSRPPEVYYEWNSLWQLSDDDKATIALKKAQAYQVDVNAAQIPATALANGRVNQLIEDGTYPGLQNALEDAAAEGETIEELNAPRPEPAGFALLPGQHLEAPVPGAPVVDPSAVVGPVSASTPAPAPGPAPKGNGRAGDSAARPFVEDINECHDPHSGEFCSEPAGANGRATVNGKSIHAATAAEAEPHLNKVFVHESTGTHATIESAGRNYDPHPDAVAKELGTLPSGKVIYAEPSRAQVRIKWVETPESSRLKGGGHAVMQQVTEHLDKYGIPAVLNTTEELHGFYARHGFVNAKNRDGTVNKFEMVREPKARS